MRNAYQKKHAASAFLALVAHLALKLAPASRRAAAWRSAPCRRPPLPTPRSAQLLGLSARTPSVITLRRLKSSEGLNASLQKRRNGCLYLWRRLESRMPGKPSTRLISVKETMMISPGLRLAVLDFEGKRLLVSVGRGGVNLVDKVDQ